MSNYNKYEIEKLIESLEIDKAIIIIPSLKGLDVYGADNEMIKRVVPSNKLEHLKRINTTELINYEKN